MGNVLFVEIRLDLQRSVLLIVIILIALGCNNEKNVLDQSVASDPDQAGVSPPGTWIPIQAGTFEMGSPSGEFCREERETQHTVTLTNNFEIQSTEVTKGQFIKMMGYNRDGHSCGSNCPYLTVLWHEAAAYCNELSKQTGKTLCYTCSGSRETVTCSVASTYVGKGIYTCPGYRLPTEAEWEYAYRAGTKTAFYNGSITTCKGSDSNADVIAWYLYSSKSIIKPAAKKKPNLWGLYDMAGNAYEWCHDKFQKDLGHSVVKNPVGSGSSIWVARGGCWLSQPVSLRAAARIDAPAPHLPINYIGFRCARTTSP